MLARYLFTPTLCCSDMVMFVFFCFCFRFLLICTFTIEQICANYNMNTMVTADTPKVQSNKYEFTEMIQKHNAQSLFNM